MKGFDGQIACYQHKGGLDHPAFVLNHLVLELDLGLIHYSRIKEIAPLDAANATRLSQSSI